MVLKEVCDRKKKKHESEAVIKIKCGYGEGDKKSSAGRGGFGTHGAYHWFKKLNMSVYMRVVAKTHFSNLKKFSVMY